MGATYTARCTWEHIRVVGIYLGEQMAYREHREIERSEIVKHFSEEVPPKTRIGRQVW